MYELLSGNAIWSILSALVVGFIAGFASFKAIISVGAHEIIKKDSYVLKNKLIGNHLLSDTIKEIEILIELASTILNSPGSVESTNAFLARTQTFLHYLDLPKSTYSFGVGSETTFASAMVRRMTESVEARNFNPIEKVRITDGTLRGLRAYLITLS